MQVFNENRRRFPPDGLTRYAGKYVAWSPDGTAILDGDEDLARLDERLKAAGTISRKSLFRPFRPRT